MSAQSEINAMRFELESIIRDLENVSAGVRKDAVGLGGDQCGTCIDKVIVQYRYVKRRLDNMDTVTLTESFKRAHGIE